MAQWDITFIWLGFFAAVFFAWYFYLQARNKERMALIESDKNVSDIYAKREIRFSFPWLKLGIIGTGLAFGVLVAVYMTDFVLKELANGKHVNQEPFVFGIITLFTALSIIIAYFVDKPRK